MPPRQLHPDFCGKYLDDEYEHDESGKLNRMLSSENKWLANIRNIRKARKLTPEVAQAMIDHINVYKTGYAQHRLEIIFRFQEERDVLEAVYHELEGGEPQ